MTDIRGVFLNILVKPIHIASPSHTSSFGNQVLHKYLSPLGALNFVYSFYYCTSILSSYVNIVCVLNVANEFLVSFVVFVVDWSPFEVDNSSESVEVADGGCGGYLSSVSVSTNGCHGNIVIIHESNDIIGHVFEGERVVVVGVTKVSRIEKPYISDRGDFVIWSIEEFSKGSSRFKYIR